MPAQIALLLTFIFVGYAFYRDRQQREPISLAILWPFLWYLVCASRPIGFWLNLWGLPSFGGYGGATEGNPTDRVFYAGLTAIGWIILLTRPINWSNFFKNNGLFVAFMAFLLMSVFWSDFISVSFKRYIKLIGSVTMVLVVLTDRNPLNAVTTIIRWTAYIHLPFSILFIKYYRHLGVSWSWDGSSSNWQGIATSKNTLGQIVVIAAIYLLWEVIKNRKTEKFRSINFIYLMMAFYLLKGSDDSISVTSASVFALCVFVFWRIGKIKEKGNSFYSFIGLTIAGTFSLLSLVILHSIFFFSESSPLGWLITTLGRDITLTDRTYIWSDVYAAASDSKFFGVGYGGFWIGRISNIPWNSSMTWVLLQAHSGYIDTYLHTGFVGVIFLCTIIKQNCKRIVQLLYNNFDIGRLFFVFFLATIYINITESTFLRGDHHMWFLFLLTILQVKRNDKLHLSLT